MLQKIEAFEHRMFSHPLAKDPNLEAWYEQFEDKAKVIVKSVFTSFFSFYCLYIDKEWAIV